MRSSVGLAALFNVRRMRLYSVFCAPGGLLSTLAFPKRMLHSAKRDVTAYTDLAAR